MFLSSKVKGLSESVTLKLNAKAVQMAEDGRQVYNLTAGQLPFKPMPEFVEIIKSELKFLKSFQYSPVEGFPDLRKKLMKHMERSRDISFDMPEVSFDCIISNGAKHSLINVLAALIDSGDEVILLTPHWVSYPQMVQYCGGTPIVVKTDIINVFTPSFDEIRKAISSNTRAIIINSPNNPTGTHYSNEWMQEFAQFMLDFPDIVIISDEIYSDLYYFDPAPTYFYKFKPQLLKQTVIVHGISKALASTGLRIGYAIAAKPLVVAMSKLQGQTTSGANSLIQRALMNLDLGLAEQYMKPIRSHLRHNARVVMELFRKNNLAHCWYQSVSAFYYLVDFSGAPIIEKYRQNKDDKEDYSDKICEDILNELGIAVVPGKEFGVPNSARISLVLEQEPFLVAMELLTQYISKVE